MVELDSNNLQQPRLGGIKAETDQLMDVFKKQKGSLAQKLANAILEKASMKIDNDMTCQAHPGQPMVAYDLQTNQFGCQ